MKVIFRNHKGTPTKVQITDLERMLRIQLPSEYKKFLSVYGFGELAYNSYERMHTDGYTQTFGLDAFLSTDEIIYSWNNLYDDEEFINAKIIPIASGLRGYPENPIEHLKMSWLGRRIGYFPDRH